MHGYGRLIPRTLTIDCKKSITKGQGPGSLDLKPLRAGGMNLEVYCGSKVSVSLTFYLLIFDTYGVQLATERASSGEW